MTVQGWFGWRRRAEWLALLLVVAAALALRLYGLGSFPDTVSADEADNTQDALRVIAGQPRPGGFFGLDWKPQPAYSVYLISLSLRLFGEGIGALRLPSALLGGLTIIPFFALARRQASPAAALAASLLMAGNLWHLHFSRSGWENIQVPFYALMAAACLLWALDSLRQPARPAWHTWALFAGAGFWSAVGLYSYFSGRLILVVLLAYAPIAIRSDPAGRRQILRGYGLMLGVAAALFAPMLPAVLGDIGFFNTRSAAVQITQDPAFAGDPIGTMLTQIRRSAGMLWDGEMSTKPDYHPVGSPFLDLPSRALLFAGMLLSLRRAGRLGRPEIWLWWLLLGIGWFATQVLTRNTPDAARGTIFLPALFLFVALGADWLIRGTHGLGRPIRLGLALLGLALLLTAVATNVARYVAWQATPVAREARQPYITLAEFPAWAAEVQARAGRGEGVISADTWRQRAFSAAPPAQPTAPPAVPAEALPAAQPDLVPALPEAWPQVEAVLASEGDGRVAQPRAVAIDPAGAIYILDSAPDAQQVVKFDRDGRFVQRWGGPGAPDDAGRFVGAWALAVNQVGEVLVLDAETGWVQIFSGDGAPLRRWGGPQLRLYKPRAMAIGPDGTIYIADTGGGRVVAVSPEGALLRSYGDDNQGAQGDAVLIEPSGVALASDGTLLVADAPAGVIRRYAPDGGLAGLWTIGPETALEGPRLVIEPDGDLIATLPSRCALLRLEPGGARAELIGGCDQPGYLRQPGALALTPEGALLVGDVGRSGVVRLAP